MRISQMNWMQLETYLKQDDRVVLPLGSTEQHGYLSLETDAILAQKVAEEAAEPLNIPVYPVLPFGMAPYFTAYPGTISLSPSNYLNLIEDLLSNLYRTGFRKILIVNGHGGNSPALAQVQDWLARHTDALVIWHNWWAAPKTMQTIKAIDPDASHASWMEGFAACQVPNVQYPEQHKPLVHYHSLNQLPASQIRTLIGDGNYGGDYQKDQATLDKIWQIGVEETRQQLAKGWAN